MSRWLNTTPLATLTFDADGVAAHLKDGWDDYRPSSGPFVVGCLGGCFRLIRAGHVAFMQHARAYVDYLLVIMVSQEGNKIAKPGPCVPDEDRIAVLRTVPGVDLLWCTDIPHQLEQMEALEAEIDYTKLWSLRLLCIKDGPRAGHTRLTTKYDTLFIPRPVIGDEGSATDIFADLDAAYRAPSEAAAE